MNVCTSSFSPHNCWRDYMNLFFLSSKEYEFPCFVFYLYVFCLSLSSHLFRSLPLSVLSKHVNK